MNTKPVVVPPPKPDAFTVSVNDVREGLVVVGDDQEDRHDHDHADHVPVRGDRVEERGHADPQQVQGRGRREEDDVEEVDVLLRVRVVEPEVEERRPERGEAVPDGGGDGDLPDQVEPAGEPSPGRATELRRPVVEAAGGRERGGDLRHCERDDRAHEADEEPAPAHGDRAALAERDVVGGQTPREDRDDRERDREVLEPAHRAEELLRVAESVQSLLVVEIVRCPALAHLDLPRSFVTPSAQWVNSELFTRLAGWDVKTAAAG